MKKTDTFIKITSLLVFIALAAYMIVSIVSRAVDPVQTSLTVTATMSDSASMSGLVVRNELIVRSTQQYIDVTAGDGSKVSAGETVAVAYSSEEALERASRLHALSREIEDVTASLSQSGTVTVTGDREKSIYNAIADLSACLRGGDLSDVDSRSSTLAGLIFPTDAGSGATEEYLQQLQAEYDTLQQTRSGDTEDITVGQSGTFSTLVDGYEGVSPEYVTEMSPSELRKMISADRVVDSASIGKLITSYDWFYAAILPQEAGRNLLAGDKVKLSFGRYYNGELNAEVEWVGRAESGEQLVLFRIERGMTDMLAVRAVSAELVYEAFSGLRVPVRGLYRYYACYVEEEDAPFISEGQSVSLTLGGQTYNAIISDVGSPSRYGVLPIGVEAGSEQDERPSHRLVVFCWPWDAEDGTPDSSSGGGTVTLSDGITEIFVTNYYEYKTLAYDGAEELEDDDPKKWNIPDRMCVFTMTGLQAERKIVELVYAGAEYCLLSSSGDDALREGNEVIVQAKGLYNGKVFS